MPPTVFVYPADLKEGEVLAGKGHLGHRTVAQVTRHKNFQTGHVHYVVHPKNNAPLTFQIFAADVLVEVETDSLKGDF